MLCKSNVFVLVWRGPGIHVAGQSLVCVCVGGGCLSYCFTVFILIILIERALLVNFYCVLSINCVWKVSFWRCKKDLSN